MSYDARLNTASALSPAALSTIAPPASFQINGFFSIKGDSDTIAQILINPDDYTTPTTEPELELDLGSSGSGTTIIVTPTAGGGGETFTYRVREHAGGTAQ